jgi:hypothetical protein
MTRGPNFYAKLPPFYENTVVEISVPSGKLIVSDELRGPERFRIEAKFNPNYGLGMNALAQEFAEKANMAYGFVGNSCPSVTRQADGTLLVVQGEYDEEEDESVFNDDETVVAKICTDHWAAMMTDYQNWLDNGGNAVEKEGLHHDGGMTVFDVTPGKYRWTAYTHNDHFDLQAYGRVVYAKLQLIEAL